MSWNFLKPPPIVTGKQENTDTMVYCSSPAEYPEKWEFPGDPEEPLIKFGSVEENPKPKFKTGDWVRDESGKLLMVDKHFSSNPIEGHRCEVKGIDGTDGVVRGWAEWETNLTPAYPKALEHWKAITTEGCRKNTAHSNWI